MSDDRQAGSGSPAYDLVVSGERVLVNGAFRPAAVAVRGGVVERIAESASGIAALEVRTLDDDEVLVPGVVDTHVHVNEPGRTEWEGFATATAAAAAGGVTTILDMPLNSIPATVDRAALALKRGSAHGECFVDVGFWGGAVPGNLGSLRSLYDAGVFGFKCFLLDSGVAEFPPLIGDEVDAAMAEIAAFDGLLIVHAEDAGTIAGFSAGHGPRYADFLHGRPTATEDIAIERVIAAARRTGCRVHIVHLSSAASVPALAAARAEGLPISVETCPHYLALTAEEVPDGQTQYKCCPPVRESANQDRLWKALADGVIDILVSDHSPSIPAMKLFDSGDFFSAWGGISSLQVSFPVVWTEARRRGFTLEQVLGWMATGTAELMGVAGKGSIRTGGDADLVVFAPDDTFVVDPGSLRHRHPVTPYAGRTLHGVVRSTYLRGSLVGDEPHGRLLERG
jgi:allantoinase